GASIRTRPNSIEMVKTMKRRLWLTTPGSPVSPNGGDMNKKVLRYAAALLGTAMLSTLPACKGRGRCMDLGGQSCPQPTGAGGASSSSSTQSGPGGAPASPTDDCMPCTYYTNDCDCSYDFCDPDVCDTCCDDTPHNGVYYA